MKPRTTLMVVAVFLALLAYVYFGELHRPTSAPATPTPIPVWSLEADQIVGLTVRSGEKQTRLVRSGEGEWRLEAPTQEPAHGERIDRVLSNLATMSPTRSFTEVAGLLEEYGLVQPSLEATVQLADGSTQTLRVGASNPQQTAYYAQVEGAAGVHLLPAWLITSLRDLLEQPPIRPTPTPTLTATPTPEATATPAATPSG
ncbi:MAG: DUF4340 domain-containing protein [Anaerolineae bacterium]|nr:DUF4340 domain-containing protein [Anaerolineae bacterium]